MPVKRRARRFTTDPGSTYNPEGKKLLGPATNTYTGRQETASTGHRRGRDGRYHEGGPFRTTDFRYAIPQRNVTLKGGLGTVYKGPIFTAPDIVSSTSAAMNSFRSFDSSDLDPDGATAIALCSPTNSNANVGTALGEILDDGILKSLPLVPTWRNRTKLAKAAGSEYLSAVFGWLPLVKEITNVGDSVRHSRTLIEHHQKGAGSNTRREFEFPIEKSVSVSTFLRRASTPLGLGSQFDSGTTPTVTKTVETVIRKWFVGSFTYPGLSGGDALDKVQGAAAQADKLFGITLTPDIVWELTPWSWAIDWFSNAGMVVHNFSEMASHGLVMKYGYIMEEKSVTSTYSMDRSGLVGTNGPPPPSQTIQVSKLRHEANPFGFGLSWEGLSPSQLLITAALGITRR
jgi:hypothetical protein